MVLPAIVNPTIRELNRYGNGIHVAYRTISTAAGAGSVRIERLGPRSIVAECLATSPLRLLTPRNHGSAAWIYSATYGGGLLDGDAIVLDVHVGEGAAAMLSTQASTKVYRSSGTSSRIDGTVAASGLLMVLPDPVVCFSASNYRQEQRFSLDESAGLVLIDWMSSGRHGAGERWQFERYATRLEVHRGRKLVLLDALRLDRAAGDPASRMGRFNVLCVVVVIGPQVKASAERAMSLIAMRPVTDRASLLAGASPIGNDGCIIRLAGESLEEVASAARECLAFVPLMLGDDPWARKW
jgi:urease accessory protein